MVKKDDWRLTNQENYLKSKELFHTYYNQKENHNHDHCAFCMETFISEEQLGYCTTDYYKWICEECYSDFKDMFEWKVVKQNK
jgi:hypothetical protein